MAAQPDISAILAALAQRPGGTPGQNGQGQAPGASYSSPPAASAASGFSLPQPSHSGSLDLSSIKPVNSGSVSLADAIATAQSKAANKGSDSRRYVRSRSRSRSPSRRETFRDGYNPYRDERRDDSRRTGSGRERSFSPNRYGDQAISRQGRDSDQKLADNQEIITVDSNAVGLIIGKNGENMRRIESESGARVQFINKEQSHGPTRQCRITGTSRQRLDAKNEIFRIQQENPNKGPGASRSSQSATPAMQQPPTPTGTDKSSQILVPDRTVGLIIGRGGETIRDLQDRSGCHVNIVGESKSINGMRPVNLIGSTAATRKAREMINEIVDSDTRGTGNGSASIIEVPPPQAVYGGYGPSPYGGYNPYGPPLGATPPSQDKVNDALMVPSDAVGMIIGKGGETIKEMQNQSQCKINVSQPTGADIQRHIELIGTRQACEHAKRLIWEKVNAVREKQGGTTRADYEYDAHANPYAQHSAPAMPPPVGMPPAGPPAAPPGGDPYAAYGGYQNYVAMWYAYANQAQAAPPPQ